MFLQKFVKTCLYMSGGCDVHYIFLLLYLKENRLYEFFKSRWQYFLWEIWNQKRLQPSYDWEFSLPSFANLHCEIYNWIGWWAIQKWKLCYYCSILNQERNRNGLNKYAIKQSNEPGVYQAWWFSQKH